MPHVSVDNNDNPSHHYQPQSSHQLEQPPSRNQFIDKVLAKLKLQIKNMDLKFKFFYCYFINEKI